MIPWTAECQDSLSTTICQFVQTHVHWLSDTILQSCALSPRSPPAFNHSQHQGLFQWVRSSFQVTKVLELQFSISHNNEYSVLVSFRIDWFDLAVQGTLKSIIQHHSLRASILSHSAYFMVQLSHQYMAIGKTIALAIQTFGGKVMPLLFNTLSRFVITFLSWNKFLLISWLQSPYSVIFEAKDIMSVTVSIVSPSICH